MLIILFKSLVLNLHQNLTGFSLVNWLLVPSKLAKEIHSCGIKW